MDPFKCSLHNQSILCCADHLTPLDLVASLDWFNRVGWVSRKIRLLPLTWLPAFVYLSAAGWARG